MKVLRWSLLLVLLSLCVACRSEPEAAAAVRTALVEVVGQGQAEQAFAGQVRASQESALSFQVPGRLVKRHVDAGQQVRAGQLLAELDATDYTLQAQAAQAQAGAAQAELARVADELRRYEQLAADQLVSRSTLEAQQTAHRAAQAQVDAARANLEVARNQAGYARLLAPADGVIASRQIEAGQVVAAGQPVLTLAAASGRQVEIALPEADIARFALGQPVQVMLWNAADERLPGRIVEIAAQADAQTRSFAARIGLDDAAAGKVVLGQSARVYLLQPEQPLSVPLAAVQGQPGKSQAQVLVVDPASGQVSAVAVEVAQWGAERAQLSSGVRPGQWVVAAGGHLLRDGEQVRAVDRDNRALSAPAAAVNAANGQEGTP